MIWALKGWYPTFVCKLDILGDPRQHRPKRQMESSAEATKLRQELQAISEKLSEVDAELEEYK